MTRDLIGTTDCWNLKKYGIFKKLATRYELPDGMKQYGKSILREPEKYFTEEIMQQLETAAEKEFKYG